MVRKHPLRRPEQFFLVVTTLRPKGDETPILTTTTSGSYREFPEVLSSIDTNNNRLDPIYVGEKLDSYNCPVSQTVYKKFSIRESKFFYLNTIEELQATIKENTHGTSN